MKTLLHKQSGFSLVELMVAMMIALIGLLAGSTMYLTTKQTNRVQQMQDALTQDGRFVMHMLQQVISQAGFRDNPGLALGNDYIVPTSSTQVTVGFFGDSLSGVECDGSMSNGNKRVTISLNGTSLQCSLQGGGLSIGLNRSATGRRSRHSGWSTVRTLAPIRLLHRSVAGIRSPRPRGRVIVSRIPMIWRSPRRTKPRLWLSRPAWCCARCVRILRLPRRRRSMIVREVRSRGLRTITAYTERSGPRFCCVTARRQACTQDNVDLP